MVDKLTPRQYDAVYSAKDYEREAHLVRDVIGRVHPGLHTLLDVACGTGAHDRYLCKYFEVDGLDIEASYLEVARQRNRKGHYRCGDMRNFSLDRLYDVVVCLFSSIGHVETTAKLVETLKCFREHLTSRGIVLVEPWATPEEWELNTIRHETSQHQGTTIARMCHSAGRGRVSQLTCEYLIGDAEGIAHVRELHELALFTREEMTEALEQAGFLVSYDPEGLTGRGLYTGRIRPG